jgi:HEAT repeat protein
MLLTVASDGARIWSQAPPTGFGILMQHRIIDTVPSLRRALHDRSPEIRGIAAGILCQDHDVASIPAIEQAIRREEDRSVKAGMVRSLIQLKDWQSRTPLRKTCADAQANPDARLLAANQILDAGELVCDAPVVAILGNRPTQNQRDLAMKYLRRRYLLPETLLPAARAEAVEELGDPNPLNRQYAGECITNFGDRGSAALLQRAAEAENDPETKRHLAQSLKRLQTFLAQNPSHP